MSAWHFAVQSGWGGLRECGECCAETELIQLHAHTHTCTQTQTSSDLRLRLRVQAAQIFVDMPQKHIAMNCFCEETTGGTACTGTVTKAWNSRFFHIGQFIPEWRGCKTFCADVFLHLYETFHKAQVSRESSPKKNSCRANYCFYLPSVKRGEGEKSDPNQIRQWSRKFTGFFTLISLF